MVDAKKSSHFTTPSDGPLIGALLRVPWEAVRARMLARLRETASWTSSPLTSPSSGIQARTAPALGAGRRLGISKQSLNYLLETWSVSAMLERRPDPDDLRASVSSSPAGNVGGQGHRAAGG
jgi:hypothetical protein